MTTDRTAPARPAALAERPANGPRKQDPAPDVFAQILGGKAPADQPKRADVRKHDDAPKAPAKDKPAADDKTRPAAEQSGVVADPAQNVTPEAPAQPVVPVEPVPNPQFVAQLSSPLPAPQLTTPEPAAQPIQLPQASPIQALAQPAAPVAQAPATPVPATPAVQAQPAAQAPTEQTTAPAVPTADTAVPAAPVKTDDVKLPQAPVATAPHAQAQQAAAPNPQAQANAGDTGQQPSQPQPEQTAAPAPTPSTAHAADAPKAEAPAEPQPAQAPAPVAQANVAAAQRAVPLYRAPHVAAAVIHLAQQHGVTHARINLKPAELGGIEVRLHSTPQGVAAHLVADSPEAAKALSQASDDLRRQLESRDVNLLSLDVSTSNGDDARETAFGFGGDAGRDGAPGNPHRSYGRGDGETPEAPAETTLVLPDGVLVDVLA